VAILLRIGARRVPISQQTIKAGIIKANTSEVFEELGEETAQLFLSQRPGCSFLSVAMAVPKKLG
jgi:hypothetical protein